MGSKEEKNASSKKGAKPGKTLQDAKPGKAFKGKKPGKSPMNTKPDKALLTVGQVSKLTGVTVRALEHYDHMGLLCPRRTGEGKANNRRLYSPVDLDRLGRIVALQAYGFSLQEVAAVIDESQSEMMAAFEDKLRRLRREEGRLRNLILFTRFIALTGEEFFEGLLNGATAIDNLASQARRLPPYRLAVREWTVNASDVEKEDAFASLDTTVNEFADACADEGIAAMKKLAERMFVWMDMHLAFSSDLGLLGWWAIFEDVEDIAAEVERVGGESMSAFVEMAMFFSFMKEFMVEAAPAMKRLKKRKKAGKDPLEPNLPVDELVGLIVHWFGGGYRSEDVEGTDVGERMFAGLCCRVMDFAEGIIDDPELCKLLFPDGDVPLKWSEIDLARDALRAAAWRGAGARKERTWPALGLE